jgi:ribose/xylose/arabinose/galactoside ABC-type transport system permease subunit
MMIKTAAFHLMSIVLLLLVMTERSAEAYIDPGTASYVFQVIAGAVLGGVFLLRTYWNRVVTTLRSVMSRDAARRS